MDPREALLSIAEDLSAPSSSSERLRRVLSTVQRCLRCDATAVLERVGEELVPLATRGLAPEVLGRRFHRAEHPRLDAAIREGAPVRFDADSALPDPYDGLLLATPDATGDVHACMACPLFEGDEVIGVLTADALRPDAFDHVDPHFSRMLGALVGAALHGARLRDALRAVAHRQPAQRAGAGGPHGGELIGESEAIRRVREEIALVARSDFTVLISGETGVGKELVARAVHAESPRRDENLVHLNCAALPESLAEAELFGHVRGAFTGAGGDRAGKFERAHGGTLFLDEVGELPASVQPKLLRALQEGEIQRVGADAPLRVDVRIVAATNRDLRAEVRAGRFREDLFHRLHMFPIHVPPLRERQEDILPLSGTLLERYGRRLELCDVRLDESARRLLRSAPFPGNVRELDHTLGRALLRASAVREEQTPITIRAEHLGPGNPFEETAPRAGDSQTAVALPAGKTMREALEDTKRAMILHAVRQSRGNWAAAARELGMARSNLHHMARRLGLRRLED